MKREPQKELSKGEKIAYLIAGILIFCFFVFLAISLYCKANENEELSKWLWQFGIYFLMFAIGIALGVELASQ